MFNTTHGQRPPSPRSRYGSKAWQCDNAVLLMILTKHLLETGFCQGSKPFRETSVVTILQRAVTWRLALMSITVQKTSKIVQHVSDLDSNALQAPSNSVAPSQYQPYPQPQEQPKVAPATYQPYSAKPVYNPLKPIKKITVPTPAQASAQKHGQQLPEPFLPHDLDSPGHSNPLKPLPAAFRPGQQRHYTGTPSYQPQAETFRPQAEPYQPQPSRYNNGASFNQAPPNPAAAEFHPREPVQLPRWQPDQEQLSHPSLTARQEQGQQNQVRVDLLLSQYSVEPSTIVRYDFCFTT